MTGVHGELIARRIVAEPGKGIGIDRGVGEHKAAVALFGAGACAVVL